MVLIPSKTFTELQQKKLQEWLCFCQPITFLNAAEVNVDVWENSKVIECHTNCKQFNELHKGSTVNGFNIFNHSTKNYQGDFDLELFNHSNVLIDGKIVDITPQLQNTNLFLPISDFVQYDIERIAFMGDRVVILNDVSDFKKGYYVYQFKDPRTNIPFYVGKGKNNRWKQHLWENQENATNYHKFCKLEYFKKNKMPVIVEFIISEIEDEDHAYEIEKQIILDIGLEKDGGPLVNICLDKRPPSQKGKLMKKFMEKNVLMN